MVRTLAFLLATSFAFADTQIAQNFSGDFVVKVNYSYLLSKPEGYEAEAKKKWPLVIFLHGSGERGSDLEKVKMHGPPKLIAAGQKFPAVIASLQCPPGDLWNPHGIKAVTDDLIKTEHIDTHRVYLTGLSMGGFGTWDTAFEYPETFAAIAPVCGGAGVRWVQAERLKTMPAWIFHGDKDGAVPVEFSHKIHDALRRSVPPSNSPSTPASATTRGRQRMTIPSSGRGSSSKRSHDGANESADDTFAEPIQSTGRCALA